MPLPCAETIDDLLADPLIAAVMRADGVDRDALKSMLGGVAGKLPGVSRAPNARLRVAPFRAPALRFAGCQARACG